MKLLHTSDLHIGISFNGLSVIEDQRYVLDEIIKLAKENEVTALIIAGDIYDKSDPSAEAVSVFNKFITDLSQTGIKVFTVSGNHDSNERVAFGSEIMKHNGICFSHVYDGAPEKYTLTDEYGNVNVYLLPFVRPANVRHFYPDEKIESYTDAVKMSLGGVKINTDERNVMVSHQFVTGASSCDSETVNVGTLDNVDGSVFEAFDYTALGHVHSPQNVGGKNIRYCGTPLKYSFSEAKQIKSVTLVTLEEKGKVIVEQLPLNALRDMREIKDTYDKLMLKSAHDEKSCEDYLHVTLTDETDVPNAFNRLSTVYPNILKLDYDNLRTRATEDVTGKKADERRNPEDIFEGLFKMQMGREMSEEQKKYSVEVAQKVWGDEE